MLYGPDINRYRSFDWIERSGCASSYVIIAGVCVVVDDEEGFIVYRKIPGERLRPGETGYRFFSFAPPTFAPGDTIHLTPPPLRHDKKSRVPITVKCRVIGDQGDNRVLQ